LKPSRFKQDDLDDIVQRTAERAWVAKPFDDENHLAAWSIVVGRNIAIDDWRRSSREIIGDVPENVGGDDVGDLVTAMITRDALLEAIGELSPAQQDSLAGVVESFSRTESVRHAVKRHRIRKDLRQVFEKFAPVIGGWRARLSRFRPPSGSAESAAALVAVAIAGLGVAALGHQSTSPVHDNSPKRSISDPAVQQVATTLANHTKNAVTGPSATRPRSVATPPIVAIPLGQDRNRSYYVVAREQRPEEAGQLLCVGEPTQSDRPCLEWPPLVMGLLERLPLP